MLPALRRRGGGRGEGRGEGKGEEGVKGKEMGPEWSWMKSRRRRVKLLYIYFVLPQTRGIPGRLKNAFFHFGGFGKRQSSGLNFGTSVSTNDAKVNKCIMNYCMRTYTFTIITS